VRIELTVLRLLGRRWLRFGRFFDRSRIVESTDDRTWAALTHDGKDHGANHEQRPQDRCRARQ
jgi:hypothetical protein